VGEYGHVLALAGVDLRLVKAAQRRPRTFIASLGVNHIQIELERLVFAFIEDLIDFLV